MTIVVTTLDGKKVPYGFSTNSQDIVDYYRDLLAQKKIADFEIA